MTPRVLIAGVGNIFLGDDAFGVEVARELATRPLPEGITVRDFGIRSFDLAYALLEDWHAVILVDAVSRNEPPGTLFVIDPELRAGDDETQSATFDGHSMDPVTVLRLAQSLGEIRPKVLVAGCEPADLGGEEGRMGLTEPVQAAVYEAVSMVEKLAQKLLAEAASKAALA